MPQLTLVKCCKKCGAVKPLEEFHRHKECIGGRQNVCRDCRNAHYREFREAHKDRYAAHQRRYRAEGRNVEQRKVYKIVQNALRKGQLIKPATCERCGGNSRIEGHHADYSKPLEVEWLCVLCHQAHHAEGARSTFITEATG